MNSHSVARTQVGHLQIPVEPEVLDNVRFHVRLETHPVEFRLATPAAVSCVSKPK